MNSQLAVVKRAWDWLQCNQITAHILRAIDRFVNRLGNQFAGAITYFSVLAVVPVLMFAFSALGWTLTVVRPEWLTAVKSMIIANVAAGPLRDGVLTLLDQYLVHWQSLGWMAVLVAIWVGAGWMGNLKAAIRGMTRLEFDISEVRRFPLLEQLLNLAMLVVLLVLVLITFTASALSTRLSGSLVHWLRLDRFAITADFVKLVSGAVSLTGGWLLFVFIYRWLPEERPPWRPVLTGSLIAAVLFGALQMGANLLASTFARNRATQIFGPVVVVMLFLDVMAQLIMAVAAWIATSTQPAVARRWSRTDLPLKGKPGTVTVEGHWEAAELDRQRRETHPEAKKRMGARPGIASAADELVAEVLAEGSTAHGTSATSTASEPASKSTPKAGPSSASNPSAKSPHKRTPGTS